MSTGVYLESLGDLFGFGLLTLESLVFLYSFLYCRDHECI